MSSSHRPSRRNSDGSLSIEQLGGHAVLCIGDVILDHYVHGSVTRISPEAPIPVLRIEREAITLGGAGNVAANIAGLGGQVYLATIVGEDEAAAKLLDLLAGVVETGGVLRQADRPTTIKSRYVSGSQQLLRADQEITTAISPAQEEALLAHCMTVLDRVHSVAIVDYAKGMVTPALAQKIIAAAVSRGIPVVVDSKIETYSAFANASVLKPNRRELFLATGMKVDDDDQVAAAGQRLIELTGVQAVVATRSEQGMSIVMRGQPAVHLRTEAKEVFDVSGAGDTAEATLALALGAGYSLIEAAELANHASGIVVAKMGTATVRLSELKAALDEVPITASHKIKSTADMVDEIERWRARGLKIGFTNGCFDILHPGHISLIREARHHCDRLILGLNSDASVKRLKGPDRPVNDEASRALVLAALENVDGLVIFEEDTPQEIIQALRPDVLVKGADYTIDQVVGADFVQSTGGTVVLAEIKAGHSTTATIRKLRG
jgi:D-beta-D-heptose 7-phosphate kinase/D-beta-D-heptose 1-phosphate adenosyltransferase